jgi:subtilisin family serine protease
MRQGSGLRNRSEQWGVHRARSRPFVSTALAAAVAVSSLSIGAAQAATARGADATSIGGVAGSEQDDPAGSNDAVPGELLVRFDPALDGTGRAAVRALAGGTLKQRLPVDGLELVRLEAGESIAAAAQRFEREAGVLYAEPNLYRRAERVPNDLNFDRLWGMHNTGQAVAGTTGTPDADIDAPEAWETTAGSTSVRVAIVDSGVDWLHPDLTPNVWTNPDESGTAREANGIDDDRNGYVDDVRGWDWVDDDNDPSDANGHGTHVAGTVGARGDNGLAVNGVSWVAGLMPLRVLDENGGGTVASLIQAYAYAAREGASVVNVSLGSPGSSQAERDTIASFPNVLFVAAAGNSGTDNDRAPEYPCSYSLDNVLCVAASDQQDGLASFSNYGAATVDLAAPGRRILSTTPNAGTAFMSGTSMATPHVSGVATLVLAFAPTTSTATLKSAILGGVDSKPAFAGKTVTGGRLNALGALVRAGSTPPSPSAPPAAPPSPTPSGRATVSDTVPPLVSVRLRRRHALKAVLRHGVRAVVGCSESCTLRGEVVRGPSKRRRSRRTVEESEHVIGRGSFSLAAPGHKVLVVKLERRAKRRLRRMRRTALDVRINATDRAGNARTVERNIRLSRRKR